VNAGSDSEVVLLATGQKLQWKNEGNDLIISLPDYAPQAMPKTNYAYTIKITNIDK
jgi:hypothetical protein